MNKKHTKEEESKGQSIREKNLGRLVAEYENKWVALSADYRRVLASGSSLKEVDASLKDSERAGAVLHKVLPFNAAYAPHMAV